jgi:hypothetical protein
MPHPLRRLGIATPRSIERFDYLHFGQFLAYRNIEIIPPTQLSYPGKDHERYL